MPCFKQRATNKKLPVTTQAARRFKSEYVGKDELITDEGPNVELPYKISDFVATKTELGAGGFATVVVGVEEAVPANRVAYRIEKHKSASHYRHALRSFNRSAELLAHLDDDLRPLALHAIELAWLDGTAGSGPEASNPGKVSGATAPSNPERGSDVRPGTSGSGTQGGPALADVHPEQVSVNPGERHVRDLLAFVEGAPATHLSAALSEFVAQANQAIRENAGASLPGLAQRAPTRAALAACAVMQLVLGSSVPGPPKTSLEILDRVSFSVAKALGSSRRDEDEIEHPYRALQRCTRNTAVSLRERQIHLLGMLAELRATSVTPELYAAQMDSATRSITTIHELGLGSVLDACARLNWSFQAAPQISATLQRAGAPGKSFADLYRVVSRTLGLAREVLIAVAYLHSRQCVHFDIKCPNFVVVLNSVEHLPNRSRADADYTSTMMTGLLDYGTVQLRDGSKAQSSRKIKDSARSIGEKVRAIRKTRDDAAKPPAKSSGTRAAASTGDGPLQKLASGQQQATANYIGSSAINALSQSAANLSTSVHEVARGTEPVKKGKKNQTLPRAVAAVSVPARSTPLLMVDRLDKAALVKAIDLGGLTPTNELVTMGSIPVTTSYCAPEVALTLTLSDNPDAVSKTFGHGMTLLDLQRGADLYDDASAIRVFDGQKDRELAPSAECLYRCPKGAACVGRCSASQEPKKLSYAAMRAHPKIDQVPVGFALLKLLGFRHPHTEQKRELAAGLHDSEVDLVLRSVREVYEQGTWPFESATESPARRWREMRERIAALRKGGRVALSDAMERAGTVSERADWFSLPRRQRYCCCAQPLPAGADNELDGDQWLQSGGTILQAVCLEAVALACGACVFEPAARLSSLELLACWPALESEVTSMLRPYLPPEALQ